MEVLERSDSKSPTPSECQAALNDSAVEVRTKLDQRVSLLKEHELFPPSVATVHYGSEQLENGTSNITLSNELVSELVSERANE